MTSLQGKTIGLCVTGSIAAYKAVVLARLFVSSGARVIPVMTSSATKFVGPLSFSAICGQAAVVDMWDATSPGERHVEIGAACDAIVIAPATADFMARMADGRANDLVAALVLSSNCPILIAPAMHPRMWAKQATARNVKRILQDPNVTLVGPVHGVVASAEVGMGRMAEPDQIFFQTLRTLTNQDLAGLRIVVSAGPTWEPLDPVRMIANRSSGKMGFAIAERAALRGANVTLVSGPVALSTPAGVWRVDVETALQMMHALHALPADAIVMAAAVADFRPRTISASKLKKHAGLAPIALSENPDILKDLGKRRGKKTTPALVGFALETGTAKEIIAYAHEKLRSKRVDLIVANHAADSIGKETNLAHLVSAEHVETLPALAKTELADLILNWIEARSRSRRARVAAPSEAARKSLRSARAPKPSRAKSRRKPR